MSASFSTEYIIAITLQGLEAVRSLRDEISLLRADSREPMEFNIGFKTTAAENMGKQVEKEVTKGIQAAVSAPIGGGKGSGMTVGLDPKSIRELDIAIGKLVRAVESTSKSQPTQKVDIDTKSVQAAVAAGVQEGLSKMPHVAPQAHTTERAIDRGAVEAQLKAVENLPGGIRNPTRNDTPKIEALLAERAKVLGGALADQLEGFRKQIRKEADELRGASSVLESSLFAHGAGSGGEGGATMGTADIMHETEELQQKYFEGLRGMMDSSKKMITERHKVLEETLSRGTERIVQDPNFGSVQGFSGDMNKSLERLSVAIARSMTEIGNVLDQRIQSMVDVLARMPAQVAHQTASAAPSWQQALESGEIPAAIGEENPAIKAKRQTRRKINAGRLAAQQMYATPTSQIRPMNNGAFEEFIGDGGNISDLRARLATKAAEAAQIASVAAASRAQKAEAARLSKVQKLVDSYDDNELLHIRREAQVGRVFFPNTRRGRAVGGIAIPQETLAELSGRQYGADFGGVGGAAGLKGRDQQEYNKRLATAEALAKVDNGGTGVSMTFGQAGNYAGTIRRVVALFGQVDKAGEVLAEHKKQWQFLRSHPFVKETIGDAPLTLGLAQGSVGTAKGVHATLLDAMRLAGRHRRPGGQLPFDMNEGPISPMWLDKPNFPIPTKELQELHAQFQAASDIKGNIGLSKKERDAAHPQVAKIVEKLTAMGITTPDAFNNMVERSLVYDRQKGQVDQSLNRGHRFYEFNNTATKVINDQISSYEGILAKKGLQPKDREVMTDRLDQLAKLKHFGGEWMQGDFKAFTFHHPDVTPQIRDVLQERLALEIPGYRPEFGDAVQQGPLYRPGLGRDYPRPSGQHRNLLDERKREDYWRARDAGISMEALPQGDVTALREQLAQATSAHSTLRGEIERRQQDMRARSDQVAFDADHTDVRELTRRRDLALRALREATKEEDRAALLPHVEATQAALHRGETNAYNKAMGRDTPGGVAEEEVVHLKKLTDELERLATHKHELETRIAGATQRVHQPEAQFGVADAAVVERSTATKEALMQSYLAREGMAAAMAHAPVEGAGGAGVPPGGKGGNIGLGFPDDEPEKIKQVKAALTDLGGVSLERLLGELSGMAAAVSKMSKSGIMPKLMEIQARSSTRMTEKTFDAGERKDRAQYQADLRRQTASVIEGLRTKEILARRMGLGPEIEQQGDRLAGAMAGTGIGGSFSPELLLHRFNRQAGSLSSQELNFEKALDQYTMRGGNSRTVLSRGQAIDASRAGLFRTLSEASGVLPRLSGIGNDISTWATSAGERINMEGVLDQYQRGKAGAGNSALSGPDRRKAAGMAREAIVEANKLGIKSEEEMVAAILKHRVAEQGLSEDIMKRGAEQMAVLKSTQDNVTFVEKLGGKMKSLAMYAGAGFLVYSGVAKVTEEFKKARDFEVEMARLQGLTGGSSGAGRELQGNILGAARRYGANPLDVGRTAAELYPSFRGDTGAALNNTLLAQRGLGFEEHGASELLLAVHEQTGGKVSGQDMLDRLAKLESSHAVTAQELAVVIQRVGNQALQVQPMEGAQDAYSSLLGMATHIMETTRISGQQTATVLRTVVSHLETPATQAKLQGFGVQMAGTNPLELRPVMDILHDLAKVYKDLMGKGETARAADLLVGVGGARQAPYVAALLDDFAKAETTATEASLAYGEAQRRLVLQLNTLDATFSRLGATVFQFFNSFLQNSGLMSVLKGVAGGSDSLLGRVATGFNTELGADVMPGAVLAGAGVGVLGLQKGSKAIAGNLMQRATAMRLAGNTSLIAENTAALTEGLASSAVLAGLGEFIALIGAIAAGAGMIKYIHDLWVDMGHAKSYVNDVDVGALKDSQQYKEYKGQANQYGMSGAALYQATAMAATAAQADMQDKKRGPGYGNALEAAYIRRLEGAVPQLGEIKDDTVKRSTALQLLRASYIQGGAVASTAAAGLDERFTTAHEALAKSLGAAATNPVIGTPQLVAVKTRAGVSYAQSTDPLGYGFGYSGVLAQKLHGNVGVEKSVKEDVGQILGHVLGGSTAEAIPAALSLVDSSGKALGKALDWVAHSVAFSGKSLGQALDDLTDKYYSYTKEDQGALGRLKGGSVDAQARALEGMGATHAATVLRNRSQLDNVLMSGLETTYGTPEQARKAREMQAGLTGSDQGASGGGMRFTNMLLDELKRLGGDQRKKLIKNGQSAAAGDLQQVIDDLTNPENRQRMALHVKEAGHRSLLRERILEPLIRYNEANMGIMAEDKMYGQEGLKIGGRFTEQQAAATDEVIKSLGGVRGTLTGDLARLKYRRHSLLESRGMQESDYNIDDASGEATYSGKDAKTRAVIATINKSVLDSPEGQANTRDIATVQKALASLANTDVMSYLDDTTRKELFAWIGGSNTSPRTLDHIMSALQGRRGALEQKIVGEHAAVFDVTAAANLSAQRLQTRQGLAHLGLQTSERFATIRGNVGLALDMQARGVVQDHASDAANILERARGSRATLDEQARQDDSFGGTQHLENIRKLDINTKTELEGSHDKLVQALTELRDTVQLDVVQRRASLVQEMTGGVSAGLGNVLGGGYSRIRQLYNRDGNGIRQLGPALLDPITDTLNKKVSENFMDSIVGKQGLLGGFFDKVFSKDIFQTEADLIYAAHVNGLSDGLSRMGLGSGTVTASTTGGASGAISAGAIVAAGGLGIGMALPSGGAGSVLDQGGLGIGAPMSNASGLNLGAVGGLNKWSRFGNLAAMMGGQIGGAALGTRLGVRGAAGNYADMGSSLGSTVGSAFGPWGTLAGGLLGGFVGGRFSRGKPVSPEYEVLQLIAANTRAIPTEIQNQTRALLNLDARYLNLPASFLIPKVNPIAGAGAGGGGGHTFNITVQASMSGTVTPEHVAGLVVTAVKQQLGASGTFSTIRR